MFLSNHCITKKRSYQNKEDAENALVYSRISSGSSGARNIYLCDDCGYWHLTSRGELSEVVKSRQREIDLAREANKFRF